VPQGEWGGPRVGCIHQPEQLSQAGLFAGRVPSGFSKAARWARGGPPGNGNQPGHEGPTPVGRPR